jgi:hypothetical protein
MRMEESQQGWSPNDSQSPYYVWHMITDAEWLMVSQSYPYSVRVLVRLHDETRWSEHARMQTEEQAKDLMQGLARLHSKKDWWVGWIVAESTCLGQEVREKPVLWYPSQERILEELHQAGLIKTGSAYQMVKTVRYACRRRRHQSHPTFCSLRSRRSSMKTRSL